MQARAGAIDELLASGALERPDRDEQGRHPARARPHVEHQRRRVAVGGYEGSARGRARDTGHRGRREPGGRRTSRSSGSRASRPAGGVVMILRILGEGQFEIADHTVEA